MKKSLDIIVYILYILFSFIYSHLHMNEKTNVQYYEINEDTVDYILSNSIIVFLSLC